MLRRVAKFVGGQIHPQKVIILIRKFCADT